MYLPLYMYLPFLLLMREKLKHFFILIEEKWANEVIRTFDKAVKQSRTEKEPKLAAEEDIVKTCKFISSQFRATILKLEKADSKSKEKKDSYNMLLVTHIMCLIRRRPVDFKRAHNHHYQKLEKQEDLLSEIKIVNT